MSRGERGRGVLLPAVGVLLGAAPGSADILDRLGCGHGRVDHLRYKPGLSVVARADGGSARWVAGFAPAAREKADKLRLKDAALGYGLREAPVPGAPGHVLMSGPLGLDNRLRGPLRAEGLLDHRGEPAGTVLNYNPWRRLVLGGPETGQGGRVSKTTAVPPGDLPALLAGLAGEGVPVLVPRPGRDARTLHYPRYGSEDLASAWERAAAGGNGTPGAARAGRILAALHASGARPGGVVEPWRPLLGVAAGVADVLPGAAGLARRTAVELLDATEPAGRGCAADVPLHGDFSADQLLVGPDGLRLIDLDRAARGPAGWDLGCFAATEILAGRHGGAEELLDAYLAARPASGRVDVGPWTGIHLMARALEPFRDAAPGWEDLVLARLRLARAALREGAGGRGTGGRLARAHAARALPELLEAGGDGLGGNGVEREVVSVRRSWPAPDGTLVFEAVDGAGRVRAGAWDGRGATLLPHAADPRLPGLSDEGTVLVHRRGKRAVVRRDTAGGTDFVKLLRPGRGPAVAETSRRLAAMALEAGLLAPRVLSAGGDAVRFSALPGKPVAEYAGAACSIASSSGWEAAWELWAGAWPALVATDADALPVHDAGREAQVLGGWAGQLLAHDPLGLTPAGRARVDARLAAVAGDLERLAADERPLVTAHRDLHDKQLLYDLGADRLGILDFDTAARADVELDLGNLLAHLELRRDQGVLSGSERDSAAARVLGVAAGLGADPRRLDAYTEAARLRLVCVYAFRPAWRGLAERWLARGRRTAAR